MGGRFPLPTTARGTAMTPIDPTATATANPGVWQLNARRWQSREALQSLLGVSERTFFRRLKSGAVEKKAVGGGTLYRMSGAPAISTARGRQMTAPTVTATPTATATSTATMPDVLAPLIARLEEQAVTIAKLKEEVASLRAEVAASRVEPSPPTKRRRRLAASSKPSPETMARLLKRRK